SLPRSLNRLMDSSDDHVPLALLDMKGFDPKEVTLTVKDGKVKVSAEHEEEQSTTSGKEYNYRKFTKEINLPQGVSEDEVTYSL
ncbi:ODFP1 protein, partial [Ceuthmochares aereus]|nr:ODFP1 protein [Ceuthmochares aereus]